MKLPALLLFVMLATLAQAASQELTPHPNPQPAPDFKVEDLKGNVHTLAAYRGKVLIVNFWATWCPPCIKEMPSLQRAWEQLQHDNIQILAVNMGDSRADVEYFAERRPVSFPVLLDPDLKMVKTWAVEGLPTTYVVNAEGQLVIQVLGDREWDDPKILEQLRALTRKPASPQASPTATSS